MHGNPAFQLLELRHQALRRLVGAVVLNGVCRVLLREEPCVTVAMKIRRILVTDIRPPHRARQSLLPHLQSKKIEGVLDRGGPKQGLSRQTAAVVPSGHRLEPLEPTHSRTCRPHGIMVEHVEASGQHLRRGNLRHRRGACIFTRQPLRFLLSLGRRRPSHERHRPRGRGSSCLHRRDEHIRGRRSAHEV